MQNAKKMCENQFHRQSTFYSLDIFPRIMTQKQDRLGITLVSQAKEWQPCLFPELVLREFICKMFPLSLLIRGPGCVKTNFTDKVHLFFFTSPRKLWHRNETELWKPFSNSLQPLFQSDCWCVMNISFHS